MPTTGPHSKPYARKRPFKGNPLTGRYLRRKRGNPTTGDPVQRILALVDMVVGENNAGVRLGYQAGRYGTMLPTHTTSGNEILAFRFNTNTGRLVLVLGGQVPQTLLDELSIFHVIERRFYGADAEYSYDPVDDETRWRWTPPHALPWIEGDLIQVRATRGNE